MTLRSHSRGFTLTELVIVMVLLGIVAGMTAVFIRGPVDSFIDEERRSELVDAAEMALRQMARDVRRAVPNSVRVSGDALEMINTVDGGRYRAAPPPGDPDERLDFTAADTDFNVLGHFQSLTKPFTSSTHRLIIYNLGVPGADAYAGTDVVTPGGTTIAITTDGNDDHVNLDTGFRFAFSSPRQRIFLADGPITYLCDGNDDKLKRYTGYGLKPDQTDVDSHAELTGAGAEVATVAAFADCDQSAFTYTPGSPTRSGLVTLMLTLRAAGETVTLLHQIHVSNAP